VFDWAGKIAFNCHMSSTVPTFSQQSECVLHLVNRNLLGSFDSHYLGLELKNLSMILTFTCLAAIGFVEGTYTSPPGARRKSPAWSSSEVARLALAGGPAWSSPA
jgi:hypothetical protein